MLNHSSNPHAYPGLGIATEQGDSQGDSLGIPGGLAPLFGGLALKRGVFSPRLGGTRARPRQPFYNIKKGSEVMGWVERGKDLKRPSLLSIGTLLEI